MAQIVKNLPARQETWALSLGGEDTLEEETATPSSESQRSTRYGIVHLIKSNKENMAIQRKSIVTFICMMPDTKPAMEKY